MIILIFLIGVFLGVAAGAMVMALCVAAHDVDGWLDGGEDG